MPEPAHAAVPRQQQVRRVKRKRGHGNAHLLCKNPGKNNPIAVTQKKFSGLMAHTQENGGSSNILHAFDVAACRRKHPKQQRIQGLSRGFLAGQTAKHKRNLPNPLMPT